MVEEQRIESALALQLRRSIERNAQMANALKATLRYIEIGGDTQGLVEQINKALTGATDE